MTKKNFPCLAAAVAVLLISACQSAYYSVWESLGKEKRHLLRDQIEAVQDDQKEASEEFNDALTSLKMVYHFDGGDLEKIYDRVSDDYEDCRQRAGMIDERIAKVERISDDLFKEWRAEIDQIQNPSFKSRSAQKLKETQVRYDRLESSMHASRKRMTPVLTKLNDYVLYLKHNLNAQAIGALKAEMSSIEADIGTLIQDINRSVQEADAFLAQLEE